MAAVVSSPCLARRALPDLDCDTVPGLAPLLEAGSTLLLGEMHGVAESPALAGDAVCLGLAAGRPVTLALELPVEESALVTGLVAATSDSAHAAARSALLGGAFWSKSYQDGRSSAARLALIERVAGWRAAGWPVRVVSFDSGVPAGKATPAAGVAREQGMADALARSIAEAAQDLVVVLVGNIHSRVTVGTPWDASYEPMGLRLGRLLPDRKTIALDLAYVAGSAWMCTTGEAASCGVRTLGGPTPAGSAAAGAARGFAVRLHETLREGHHGVYDVGRITPSLPARQSRAAASSERPPEAAALGHRPPGAAASTHRPPGAAASAGAGVNGYRASSRFSTA